MSFAAPKLWGIKKREKNRSKLVLILFYLFVKILAKCFEITIKLLATALLHHVSLFKLFFFTAQANTMKHNASNHAKTL